MNRLLLPLPLFLLACKPTLSPTPQDSPTDTGNGVLETGGDSGGSEQIPNYQDTAAEPPELCHMALVCDEDVSSDSTSACTFQIITGDGDRLYQDSARANVQQSCWGDVAKPRYAITLVEEVTLIAAGSTWKYLDDGSQPDESWNTLGYDDSAWAEGPAPLGYGDDQTTVVSYGDDSSDKHPATWFRLVFDVETLDEGSTLDLALRRDDGGMVYLNGAEAFRCNMPDGDIDATTYAAGVTSGSDESTFFGTTVGSEMLVLGENLAAVSIHQANGTSSDITMDLSLSAPGARQVVDLLDMGEDSDWLLDGVWYDRSLMKNKLAFDLFRAMGEDHWVPEVQLGDLSQDGTWQGIYLLAEAIEVGDHRLPLQQADDGGSFIVHNSDDTDGILADDAGGGSWHMLYPDPDTASEAASSSVAGWLQGWQQAVTEGVPAGPDEGVFAWLDLDSAVDYVILQELGQNWNAYHDSIYLWKDSGGLMHLMPWEMELSFGFPCDEEGYSGWNERPAWVEVMAGSSEFQSRFTSRWQALRERLLATNNVLARIASYRDSLGDRVYSNFELWPLAEITWDINGENGFCDFTSYDEEYGYLRERVEARLAWMDDHAAEFSAGAAR